MTARTVAVFAILNVAAVAAQVHPNFSGRWTLIAPANAPADLTISHDERSLAVVHAMPAPACPRAGTHEVGSSGVVTGGTRSASDVFWFGGELIVASSFADAQGVTEAAERWSLEGDRTLVIVCEQRRAGRVVATRTVRYSKS